LIANYLLTFDGRYRDFAIILYALPILQLSLGLQILKQSIQLSFSAYRWLGILLIATAGICLYREPSNLLALAWLFLCGLIAWANWPVKTASTIQNTPSI
jgi:multidrug transporter EmrE-like cation transporter